jgi:hypothetical protein
VNDRQRAEKIAVLRSDLDGLEVQMRLVLGKVTALDRDVDLWDFEYELTAEECALIDRVSRWAPAGRKRFALNP